MNLQVVLNQPGLNQDMILAASLFLEGGVEFQHNMFVRELI